MAVRRGASRIEALRILGLLAERRKASATVLHQQLHALAFARQVSPVTSLLRSSTANIGPSQLVALFAPRVMNGSIGIFLYSHIHNSSPSLLRVCPRLRLLHPLPRDWVNGRVQQELDLSGLLPRGGLHGRGMGRLVGALTIGGGGRRRGGGEILRQSRVLGATVAVLEWHVRSPMRCRWGGARHDRWCVPTAAGGLKFDFFGNSIPDLGPSFDLHHALNDG